MPAGALLIRCDANASTGTGHLMRMLALAEEWLTVGARVVLAGVAPERLLDRARAVGVEAVREPPPSKDEGEWTSRVASSFDAGWVAADGYQFPVAFQSQVRHTSRLMVVDDNGENGSYDADVILNVNVHASPAMYDRRNAEAVLLLGPRYALVRQAFRHRTEQRRDERPTLLVTMGGADPIDATGALLRALPGQLEGWRVIVLVGAANPRLSTYQDLAGGVELLHDVVDVAGVMAQADVALAAAGGTLWELGVMGVPTIGLALADNQVGLASELERLGCVEYAGDARRSSAPAEWLARARALFADRSRGEAMVAQSRRLVDGQGALRVVQRMRGL